MSLRSSVLVFVMLASASLVRADAVEPIPAQSVWPQAPAAATRGEGAIKAKVRIAVRPDGSVASVDVLGVSEADVGLEDAARQAVEGWWFAPTVDGEDLRTWEGDVPFVDPVDRPIARMYSVESARIRGAIRHAMDAAGVRLVEDHHEIGHMVTEWVPVRNKKVRDLEFTSDLLGMKPTKFRLYFFAPPWSEPGRVYVNSEIELKLRGETGTGYNMGDVERWALARIAAELGEPGHPVPRRRGERRRLGDAIAIEPVERCSAANPDGTMVPDGTNVTNPQLIERTKVRPPFPAGAANRYQEGDIILQAVINEDGAVHDVEMLRGFGGDPEFMISAKRTVQFWRYRPAKMNDCPVDVYFKIAVRFTIDRR